MPRKPALLPGVPPRLLTELTRPWAPPRGATVVVAVSGGADSVALLQLLAHLAPGRGWSLAVASLDHGLRGPAGADDLHFVERLAADLGWPFHGARAAVAVRAGRSPEAAARAARMAFLKRTAAASGAIAIAVAHTLDDQAETVLYRLARGAGLRGTSAMRRWAPPLWRPLLGVRRAALREVLSRAGRAWREDETNTSSVAVRNRLRHEVFPLLEDVLGPRVVTGLARAADLAADDEAVLAARAGRAAPGLVIREDARAVAFDRRAVADLPPAVSRRILRSYCDRLTGRSGAVGAAHLEALLGLAGGRSPGTRADLPHGLAACRKGRALIVSLRPETHAR